MNKNTLQGYFKDLEKLELEQKDVRYSSSKGIPLTDGYSFLPKKKEIIIPTEQLENAGKMFGNSGKAHLFDVHPIAILYRYHLQFNGGNIHLPDYIDNISDKPNFWTQNTRIIVDKEYKKKLSITVNDKEYTVTTN